MTLLLGYATLGHYSLKPRVAAQRIEQRIDPEPGNREPFGDGQQVFDLIEGGVVLAYHHENGHPTDAHLGPTERVSGEWQQFDRPLSFPEGVGSPAEARVGYPQEGMELRQVRPTAQALLEEDPCRVIVGTRERGLPASSVQRRFEPVVSDSINSRCGDPQAPDRAVELRLVKAGAGHKRPRAPGGGGDRRLAEPIDKVTQGVADGLPVAGR